MKLTLVDGPNWFRRRAEVDLIHGSPVRNCFNEIQNKDGLVIVIWDGFNALQARRKIYPAYKGNRKPAGDTIYDSQNLLKKLLRLSKAIQICVDGYEADDVIANLVNKYKEKIPNIFIESNDADLWQLGCDMARQKPSIDPDWMVLYKTLVGDPSDNIHGMAGFGKKSFEDMKVGDRQRLEGIIINGWGMTETEVREAVTPILSNKQIEWFCKKENRQLLLDYYKIINFQVVPEQLITDSTVVGVNKPNAAEEIMKEFML